MAKKKKEAKIKSAKTGKKGLSRKSIKPEDIWSPDQQKKETNAMEPIRILLRFLNSEILASKDKKEVTFALEKLTAMMPKRTSLRNVGLLLPGTSKRAEDDDDSNGCNNDGDPWRNDNDSEDVSVIDCQAD